jgi:hypothetical protein
MHKLSVALSIALALGTSVAQEQPRVQFTKDQLMAEVAGICRDPDGTFPKPIPPDKRPALTAYCSCVRSSIDAIPDDKLQQAAEETFREYAQYKSDPSGFKPTGKYSLIRISKACINK